MGDKGGILPINFPSSFPLLQHRGNIHFCFPVAFIYQDGWWFFFLYKNDLAIFVANVFIYLGFFLSEDGGFAKF